MKLTLELERIDVKRAFKVGLGLVVAGFLLQTGITLANKVASGLELAPLMPVDIVGSVLVDGNNDISTRNRDNAGIPIRILGGPIRQRESLLPPPVRVKITDHVEVREF